MTNFITIVAWISLVLSAVAVFLHVAILGRVHVRQYGIGDVVRTLLEFGVILLLVGRLFGWW